MTGSISSFIGQVAAIALTVKAIHWLTTANGASLPRTGPDGSSIYGMKWQWRAVGLAGGLMSAVIALKGPYDLATVGSWLSLIAFPAIALMGLWLAIGGSIKTDQSGITKKVMSRSYSLHWGDITEIRLHSKQGAAIELRAGSKQKLTIDSRFVALQHLLNEIKDRTKLQPIPDNPT